MRFASCNSALDLLTFSYVLLSKPVDPMSFNELLVGKFTNIKPKPFPKEALFSILSALFFYPMSKSYYLLSSLETLARINNIFASLKKYYEFYQEYCHHRSR